MNGDHSDVMNNETTFLNNDTSVNGGTHANETSIPVPHGLDDQEVKEWLESLDSLLESTRPQIAAPIPQPLPAPPTLPRIALPFTPHTPSSHTIPPRPAPP